MHRMPEHTALRQRQAHEGCPGVPAPAQHRRAVPPAAVGEHLPLHTPRTSSWMHGVAVRTPGRQSRMQSALLLDRLHASVCKRVQQQSIAKNQGSDAACKMGHLKYTRLTLLLAAHTSVRCPLMGVL